MSWWSDIKEYVERNSTLNAASRSLNDAKTLDALEKVWAALPADVQAAGGVSSTYALQKSILQLKQDGLQVGFEKFIGGALDAWLAKVEQYGKADPAHAKENLAKLSAHVIEVAGVSAAIDIGLGAWPGSAGAASATNSKQLLAWLGFGAVLAAVAHDPVKIGLLRPYQDSLEQTFRNRRPGDFELFQAYRTRELTATKADDLAKLDDTLMDTIEKENQTYYDKEIAKWGYSVEFAGALARSATRTLNFSQLSALARQGLLSRGLAIYSLWGEGLDRTVMKPALDALMQQNEIASYDGFRAQIERGYVENLVSEEELMAYYAKLHVPADVQKIMLPHMQKLRDEYKRKAETPSKARERDLTVSQITQAYEAALIDRTKAQNMVLALGFSKAENDIILDLADTRKKLPGAAKLKRLTLTDYEKAYKAKLITLEDVLSRMRGEYTAEDIELEKKLLEAGKA